MSDPTKPLKDIVAELDRLPPADDISNAENWNIVPTVKQSNSEVKPLVGEGIRDARTMRALGLMREHHARFNFEAAQNAEREKGVGLDFGLNFYRRKGDGAEFTKRNERGEGNTGVPLLFKGINFVAARTGGGKTFFLCALAALALYKSENENNTAMPQNVLFISLEEPASDIMKHVITAFLNIKHRSTDAPRITERDVTAALLGELSNSDKVKIIQDTYDILAQRLIVIDKRSFQIAVQAAKQAEQDIAVLDSERIEEARTAVAVICESLDHYRDKGNAVFFIDYAQRLRDPDSARSAATYKEMQAVASHLITAANYNAVMFIAAQMNRDDIKGARRQNLTRRGKCAKEFYEMIAENMREAADLEQSAQKIIYVTIDKDTKKADDDGNAVDYLNLRLLKNRSGIQELYASAPIDYAGRTVDFTAVDLPTLPVESQDPYTEDENNTGDSRAYTVPTQSTKSTKGPRKAKLKPRT